MRVAFFFKKRKEKKKMWCSTGTRDKKMLCERCGKLFSYRETGNEGMRKEKLKEKLAVVGNMC